MSLCIWGDKYVTPIRLDFVATVVFIFFNSYILGESVYASYAWNDGNENETII